MNHGQHPSPQMQSFKFWHLTQVNRGSRGKMVDFSLLILLSVAAVALGVEEVLENCVV